MKSMKCDLKFELYTPIYTYLYRVYQKWVGTTILTGNKIRQTQPVSLVTFWGKITLKRYKNHRKFSRN
jgi:hypothetical protein